MRMFFKAFRTANHALQIEASRARMISLANQRDALRAELLREKGKLAALESSPPERSGVTVEPRGFEVER